jgi:hypothetical protein
MAKSNLFTQTTEYSFDMYQGRNVFIRTVTHYYTGNVVGITPDSVFLTQAAWVAETARWSECIADGTLNEVEAYPKDMTVCVSRAALVDICEWLHELPVTNK